MGEASGKPCRRAGCSLTAWRWSRHNRGCGTLAAERGRMHSRSFAFGGGVSMASDNESWIVEEGGRVIHKRAEVGSDDLVPWESLVYALWWADYAMRNGESLAAANMSCDFHANGLRAAKQLSLPLARELFGLDLHTFEKEYLDRFDAVCD